MPGTNAKMNEFQALMGLEVLNDYDILIAKKKLINDAYRSCLKDIPGIVLRPELDSEITPNYAYIPVEIIKEEYGLDRDAIYEKLKSYNIFTRRYFTLL